MLEPQKTEHPHILSMDVCLCGVVDGAYPWVQARTGRQGQRVVAQQDRQRIQPRVNLDDSVVQQHEIVRLGGAAIVRDERIEAEISAMGRWVSDER